MGVWRRHREAASAGLSTAPYSAYHGLYSEAVVSSIVSAVALAEAGQFKKAVQYLQKAAKTLYETAKDVFEHVKVADQRLVELFVEAVTQVLAWVNKHRAYLFLMAAGAVALSAALNMRGLAELEKLAHAASLTPFFFGLADVGEKAAERFRALGERYERWRVDESLIDEVLNAPLRGERPYAAFLKLARSRRGLTPPLVELRKALMNVKGEAEKDAVVVAALVLYKTLVKNAGAYREWAGWYKWARGRVKEQDFTAAARDIKRLHEAQKRLEKAAEQVRRELNNVLTLYSQKRDIYEKLKPHLEVDVKKAEELAEASYKRLSDYSDANMGTKAYAALLSITRGGIYGHVAMLLMGEGALADIVMSTPATAHWRAREIARGRGEAIDPSRSRREAKAGGIARGRGGAVDPSRVGAADWEDRTASVLLRFLIGYGEADPRLLSGAGEENLKFRRVEKDGKKERVVKGVRRGFQVFRAYGGVEAPVGELWIGDVARFKVSKEELRRLVEEAERTAPDLSGIRKMRQTLPWLNTDVSFDREWIVASTAHPWQLRWYVALFGKPESSRGRANITEEGIKPNVTMYWRREVLDRIIAEESNELEPLLGRPVKSWRDLVNAINWRWVLKRVEELVDELKPRIGRRKMDNAKREGPVRRMLGELALFVHFAEARSGMDNDKWREERTKRLAEAVEALSNGRIDGKYADKLAQAIIRYAEGRKKKAERRIKSLAKEVGVSREEVWGVVEFVLGDMYCLARDCARDEVMRKFVAPALELIMLDKVAKGEFSREEALLLFGEMYATAIAGDGTVEPGEVELAVGGELGGGAALLRLAALHLLNQFLPKESAFNVRVYIGEGRYYYITAYGENAARFKRLLAVSAPSAGGEYLSEKFGEFVEEARVEVRLGNIRRTKRNVAADLTLSEAGVAVNYNVYLLKDAIELQFHSTDRSRAELAARLLKLAGVGAEMKKVSERGEWHVWATTDGLAAGRKELRDALAEIVRRAVESGWVDASKAKRWLEKLGRGRVLKEGWPKYHVGFAGSGALEVKYQSPNPNSIVQEAQRLRELRLVEGVHFSVKMPEGGKGYVYILREGLAYAAWLSVHGEGERQRLAAEFVEYILQRAKEEGGDVYRKALEVVEEGKARGSLTLKGLEKKVEVEGREHVVKVIDGDAELEKSQSGKKLLRLRISAEVDGVRREYEITFSRRGVDNKAVGFVVARVDAPGGRETDAERLSALIEVLTGRKPGAYRMKNGAIIIMCGREHLEGFRRYAELADAIAKWLEETSR
jgi:hypothetical protein